MNFSVSQDVSKQIWREYEALLEKCQRNFNRLRELPPYGRSSWEQQFHKAFHVYSRLWKYQQDHRLILTEEGLKRWDIGDIASKIGQLYYNYYLRTSETRFLHESYVFYEAIRSRHYFAQATSGSNYAIKQLRYYARFIIICLLLDRREEVWSLLQEFQALINSYCMKFQPADAQEWKLIIHEVTTFLHADYAMPLPKTIASQAPFKLCLRCQPDAAEVKALPHTGRLKEAVLVTYYHKQVKIAELPLDTFRVLQALEWEETLTQGSAMAGASLLGSTGEMRGTHERKPSTGSSQENGAAGLSDPAVPLATGPALENPNKHMMYRPSTSQLLALLSTTCDLVTRDGIVLLYISASSGSDTGGSMKHVGSTSTLTQEGAPMEEECSTSRGPGGTEGPEGWHRRQSSSDGSLGLACTSSLPDGVYLSPHRVSTRTSGGRSRSPPRTGLADMYEALLIPDDLIPLTRRALFLIVDSDGSKKFTRIQGQERGTYSCCLMSPSCRPPDRPDSSTCGNVFTMFLTAPLMAFCWLCKGEDPPPGKLEELQGAIHTMLAEWCQRLVTLLPAKSPWSVALSDAFLRQFILRFIFCRAVLGLHHELGGNPLYQPSCFPSLPRELLPGSAEVAPKIQELGMMLGMDQQVFSHGYVAPPVNAMATD